MINEKLINNYVELKDKDSVDKFLQQNHGFHDSIIKEFHMINH